jgi:hypothetical protein
MLLFVSVIVLASSLRALHQPFILIFAYSLFSCYFILPNPSQSCSVFLTIFPNAKMQHMCQLKILFHLTIGKRPLEMVFTMGSSNPNGRTIFNWQKNIVKEMLKLYSPLQNVMYGLTVYGSQAVSMINIGDMRDTQQVSAFLERLTWPGEENSFEEGLVQAEQLFDKSPNSNPRKVLVLFVNGRADVDSSTLRELVKRLMKKGIELRLVAIGNRVNNNQINILTGGSEDIVVETSETQQPTDVARRLRDKIAKGMLVDTHLTRVCIQW